MHKDWIFKDEDSICHFRVAAVLIRENKLFIQRIGDECALPGGHVAFGETSEEALIREFREEAGAEIICERLIWVEENFWKWGGKKAHNISFYYLISLKDDSDIQDNHSKTMMDNKDVQMQWIPLDEIPHLEIYPQYIKEKINNITSGVEHFIRNDW